MKLILAIVLNLILVANCLKLADLPRKSLAGPPSEFAANAIPEPISGALVEDSAYYEVTLAPKDPNVIFKIMIKFIHFLSSPTTNKNSTGLLKSL